MNYAACHYPLFSSLACFLRVKVWRQARAAYAQPKTQSQYSILTYEACDEWHFLLMVCIALLLLTGTGNFTCPNVFGSIQ